MSAIILGEKALCLKSAQKIANGAIIYLSPKIKKNIEESRKLVEKLAKTDTPYYGINTGFGFFANKKIPHSKQKELQKNIITSHASGWGAPLSIPETRLCMTLRFNVLTKGFTGVSYELCEALLKLITAEIYPIIPSYGSVGASGDLAPLAHLALPLIGKGKVHFKEKTMDASEALRLAKISPYVLNEKEGLSLINGTQVMLSIGSIALIKALSLLEYAEKIAALSFEALFAHLQPLDPRLHQLRRQEGQIISAKKILEELKGSYLHDDNLQRTRVQDPYSLRCAPQVHGASRDSLNYAKAILERELDAVTDNPLVFHDSKEIVSGGNFHGQPIAFALDIASIALSELSNISERRQELLLNPNTNGTNSFLAVEPGIDSGYMAAQYLSASLVNENKLLANPAVTDSIPGNVGIEDHVSMGMTSARKFRTIVENCATVLSVELLFAAQAIDLLKIKKLGNGTKSLYKKLRKNVPMWSQERILSEDIENARKVIT